MNDKFTERLRKVISRSREEALRLHANEVGTKHLLLALIGEPDGVASAILLNLGIDLDRTRLTIESRAARAPGKEASVFREDPNSSPYSNGAKRALELMVGEARELGHLHIGTEHLLLGLIREGRGVAAKVLGDLGVDRVEVRGAIHSLLGGSRGRWETPCTNEFGVDLTQLARDGKLDPVFGREEEIERVMQILLRRTKTNPILIGEPGVGKTTIVHGLAHRIVRGNVPEDLRDCRLIALNPSAVVANAKYWGQVARRLMGIVSEILERGNAILFIDQLYAIVVEGEAEWAADLSKVLKAVIARGELQCIGTMSPEDYHKHVEEDVDFRRCFEGVPVEPPTREQTILILKGLREKFEARHRVRYTDEALVLAVDLVPLYLPDLPPFRGVFDVIDAAGGRRTPCTEPEELVALKQKIDMREADMQEATRDQDFQRATRIQEDLRDPMKEYLEARVAWLDGTGKFPSLIGERAIQEVVSEFSGVHVSSVAARTDIPISRRALAAKGVPRFERSKAESFLPGGEVKVQRGLAVVLSPCGENGQRVYESAILPALEGNGLRAARAEDLQPPGARFDPVWSSIRCAEVVVADLSSADAIVTYELGLCHALKRCPILLVRDPAELPSHLRSLRCIRYEDSVEGVEELKSRLTDAVSEFLAAVRGEGGGR